MIDKKQNWYYFLAPLIDIENCLELNIERESLDKIGNKNKNLPVLGSL